jgi:pimeloyl-ACP methyl ester carboxylesterase
MENCKFAFALLVLVIVPFTAVAQSEKAADAAAEDFAGTWSGVLEVGAQSLRLELEIEFSGDAPQATLVSLDQGGARIPVDDIRVSGHELSFSASSAGITYDGSLTGDVIEGEFRQGGQRFELTFERGGPEASGEAAGETSAHPRDTEIEVQSGEVSLAGYLRLPEGEGPFPGVVILSGSGAQDRDGMIGGHALYRAVADVLEEQGIASLRLDDRGVGASEPVAPDSPDDLAADAGAALAMLRGHERIGCAGFIGHSEGGLIALLAAREANPAFIVSMAGMHAPVAEVLVEQAAAIMRASGATDEQIAANRRIQEAVFDSIEQVGSGDAVEAIRKALIEAGLSPKAAEAQARTWGQPYAVALFDVDPAPAAADYAGPLLAYFGENDLQVPPDAFAERLARQRGDLPTEIRIVDGVDHLFQESESGLPRDYGKAGHALAPAARVAIAAGITDLTLEACRR